MKRISAWFDQHPKTRIALQLVLDGLPLLVAVLCLHSLCTVDMIEDEGSYLMQPNWFYYVTLGGLMLIPIPSFVISFIWRDKDYELFGQHRCCLWISNMLRIPGVLVVGISLLVDLVTLAIWTTPM